MDSHFYKYFSEDRQNIPQHVSGMHTVRGEDCPPPKTYLLQSTLLTAPTNLVSTSEHIIHIYVTHMVSLAWHKPVSALHNNNEQKQHKDQ